MWVFHSVALGFVFLVGLCVTLAFSFEGRFTELPSNMTVKEGQNINMACAFQSIAPSVYLEIQWWFVKAQEPKGSDDYELEAMPEPDPDDEGTKISTVKVHGNNISHRLQISGVSLGDEGLYECRVTRADYGEILEYKVQAWLKVNATEEPPKPPPPPPEKTSPLHLTNKKPRKNITVSIEPHQSIPSTASSIPRSSGNQHISSEGTRRSPSCYLPILLLVCGLV